jgi:hypothetical protein
MKNAYIWMVAGAALVVIIIKYLFILITLTGLITLIWILTRRKTFGRNRKKK